MALFTSETKDALKKLAAKAYESTEDRDALLAKVAAAEGLKPNDIIWMLFRPDRALRDWGAAWLRRWWGVVSRPAVHYSLGFLTLGGFIAGIVFWGAFNTGMELLNGESFCVGCHEMRDNPFAELKPTIHYACPRGAVTLIK